MVTKRRGSGSQSSQRETVTARKHLAQARFQGRPKDGRKERGKGGSDGLRRRRTVQAESGGDGGGVGERRMEHESQGGSMKGREGEMGEWWSRAEANAANITEKRRRRKIKRSSTKK